jgi:Uma2 family endonuclease
VRLNDFSEPQPDIALLRPRPDFYTGSGDVRLIVEVADSTLKYDRDIKIPLYARHGIPEVWLVDIGRGEN